METERTRGEQAGGISKSLRPRCDVGARPQTFSPERRRPPSCVGPRAASPSAPPTSKPARRRCDDQQSVAVACPSSARPPSRPNQRHRPPARTTPRPLPAQAATHRARFLSLQPACDSRTAAAAHDPSPRAVCHAHHSASRPPPGVCACRDSFAESGQAYTCTSAFSSELAVEHVDAAEHPLKKSPLPPRSSRRSRRRACLLLTTAAATARCREATAPHTLRGG